MPLQNKRREFPPIELNQPFPFGKHKGKTLKHIIERDISYLDWLMENTDVKISEEAEAFYQDKYFQSHKEDEDG